MGDGMIGSRRDRERQSRALCRVPIYRSSHRTTLEKIEGVEKEEEGDKLGWGR